MRKQGALIGLLIGVAAVQTGCSAAPAVVESGFPSPIQESAAQQGLENVLAGEWVFLDGGMAYSMTLDENGNGSYAWKEGSFVTTSFSDGLWRGRWHQRQNDREGGFEVRLSEDYSEGEGRWWYTRIGANPSPNEPGGTFNLNRATSEARTIHLRSQR